MDFNISNSSLNRFSEKEIESFKKAVSPLIDLELEHYKPKQMERRIVSFMNRARINTFEEMLTILKTNKAELERFVNALTINVSEFFRDVEKFNEFENKYLPELVDNFDGKLRIWSAGSSIGAEIYSIAMILDRHGLLSKATLYASDLDLNVIKKAKDGIYTETEIATLKKGYDSYFKKVATDQYMLSPKITARVNFKRQNLLKDRFDKDLSFILCRNVVIYFTEEAKTALYKKFFDSLSSKGLLFVGATESIHKHKELGLTMKSAFFYQKP